MLKLRNFFLMGTMAVALLGLTACSENESKNNTTNKSQKITKAGTYEFSGDIDGGIVVDAGKEDEVTLVLNGVNLTSKDDAVIKVLEAKKVTITLNEGSKNTIEDTEQRDLTEESAVDANGEAEFDAAIYSKSDLYLNGTGELQVTGNFANGITGKDSVYIEEGTYDIQAVNHAVKGKDYLEIQEGNFKVNCEQDAFHSNGDVLIQMGDFSVECGDDAFHADAALTIMDGTIDIKKCGEGLEGKSVTVSGGDISLVSSDDGINAASSEETTDTATANNWENPFELNSENEVRIEGGNIYINAEGDGIDANGSIVISGGSVQVDGPKNSGNGALDYTGTFDVSGGSIIAVGSSGMAQGISDSSSVYGIMMTCDTQISANVPVVLEDEQGELIRYSPSKTYNNIVIASVALEQGKNYTLKIGDDISVAFTISDTMTYLNKNGISEGQNGMNGGWGKGGRTDKFDKTQIPDNLTNQELPEGMEFPQGMELPQGKEFPEGMEVPDGMEFSENMGKPNGMGKNEDMRQPGTLQESTEQE